MTVKGPRQSTIKKLYALTANTCAFSECAENLVDAKTGTLAARVCHIKGHRNGSARYDENQSDEERHGFDNLVIMCPKHSDIIDDPKNVGMFTVEVLRRMKATHEATGVGHEPSKQLQERFGSAITIQSQTVVKSVNQSGGQTANVIHNYNAPATSDRSSEFRKRNLIDVKNTEFARTSFSTQLGFPTNDGLGEPPAFAVLFGKLHDDELSIGDELASWADGGDRRYPPIQSYPFLPTVMPDRVRNGWLWYDRNWPTNDATYRYSKYVVAEANGLLECGFSPCHAFDQNGHGVYYAKCVAYAFAFCSFVKDVEKEFSGGGPVTLGIAIACRPNLHLRGIKQSIRGVPSRLAVNRNIGCTVDVDSGFDPHMVIKEFAQLILVNWRHPVMAMEELPEFRDGRYEGQFFRDAFAGYF